MNEYRTASEAARTLQVSPRTVRRWIVDKKLAASSTVGGHYRISVEDLLRLKNTLGIKEYSNERSSHNHKTPPVDR